MGKYSFLAVVFLSSSAFAGSLDGAEVKRNLVYGTLGAHYEARSGESAQNGDFFIGYDRLVGVDSKIYVGGRLGVFRERVLTFGANTNTKGFIGAHAYKLFQMSDVFAMKAGIALDLLRGDANDPVYLYTGGETGFRWRFGQSMYGEIPIEVGIFPAFSGIPLVIRTGFQLGFGF